MKEGILALALSIVTTCFNTAHAQAVVRGVGTTSCAEYAKVYAADPKASETIYFSWAQGFMSGWDFAEMTDKNEYVDINAIPYDQQEMMIRDYCDAHPLKTYWDAVLSVLLALNEKGVHKSPAAPTQ